MKITVSDAPIEAPVYADFGEQLKVQLGNATVSSKEGREILKKAFKNALSEVNVSKLVQAAAEEAILSSVRGYFTHGEGRLAIDAAVKKVVVDSPLLKAIRGAEGEGA